MESYAAKQDTCQVARETLPFWSSPSFQLILCGFAILFVELSLIRWLGSCVRVIAYYSNFILMTAFLGLGIGSLSGARGFRGYFLLPVFWGFSILLAPVMGEQHHLNPEDGALFTWFGFPKGLMDPAFFQESPLSFPVILGVVFLSVLGLFFCLGAILSEKFGHLPPLKGYSLEIGGSLLGIGAFSLISFLEWGPPVWFAVGSLSLILLVPKGVPCSRLGLLLSLLSLVWGITYSSAFIWSPYYRIELLPVNELLDFETKKFVPISSVGAPSPIQELRVNSDYHQMMLDLSSKAPSHSFFDSWRELYEFPYRFSIPDEKLPTLILGAGTGNDVAAALRKTSSPVIAVDIDPTIQRLGRSFHPEKPYDNSRVTSLTRDARNVLVYHPGPFGRVVFAFLDSHTLFSQMSSLRLDNYVYTSESLALAWEKLSPGGILSLTFATVRPWIHQRILGTLEGVSGQTPQIFIKSAGYTNGTLYLLQKKPVPAEMEVRPGQTEGLIPGKFSGEVQPATDDWPFLYLQSAGIPSQYRAFLAVVVFLGFASLFLLPSGERIPDLVYFFLGGGFFLLETSNVIRLSLLFGSTWMVNLVVFSLVLVLVLAGNALAFAGWGKRGLGGVFLGLSFSLIPPLLIPPSYFLGGVSPLMMGFCAAGTYLLPLLFASLIFAVLISREESLSRAYGSNILGASVGGVMEYFSLIGGMKILVPISMIFYLLAFIAFYFSGKRGT